MKHECMLMSQQGCCPRSITVISSMAFDVQPLAAALDGMGFDVFTTFKCSWYNDYIESLRLATDADHVGGVAFRLAPLPHFGRGGDALALLIGNSKAMWPVFLRWMRDRIGSQLADPVDSFAAETIGNAVAHAAGDTRYEIFWAADFSPERLVDMNRAAFVSGLCYFSDETFLSIHPTFGPWVAFRAVVVLDLPADGLGAPPAPMPPLLSKEESIAAKAAFEEAMAASSAVDLSCSGMTADIATKWAAMRDCVSLGREHKYSALQSEYHYTKNRDVLVRAMDADGQPHSKE
ncbi:hypothetical protein AB1Y20_010536 [Prymnesium parvum]|uniref:Cyanocobalamin reductase (cyanide-eliminating) n=1 Tax=Prymnesium parvum TaxID=97485 RepID=A0AB34INY7_PRYPA